MWTPVSQPNLYEAWQCVATNHNGSVLIAGVYNGEIWINTQGTWINVVTAYFPTNDSLENKAWTGVASNFAGDMPVVMISITVKIVDFHGNLSIYPIHGQVLRVTRLDNVCMLVREIFGVVLRVVLPGKT